MNKSNKKTIDILHIGLEVVVDDNDAQVLTGFPIQFEQSIVGCRKRGFLAHDLHLGTCIVRVMHKGCKIDPVVVDMALDVFRFCINEEIELYTVKTKRR